MSSATSVPEGMPSMDPTASWTAALIAGSSMWSRSSVSTVPGSMFVTRTSAVQARRLRERWLNAALPAAYPAKPGRTLWAAAEEMLTRSAWPRSAAAASRSGTNVSTTAKAR
ncbi:hypothetical protein SMD44_08295 [Streptomyces alboflavus]|uniref:Uncharacterized protein n=1 Tax=Streptomyces alboflavus TaxID=67267 RepID=A0A1Z1WQU0_9ACTN|nr:hypothetical protein SMD44_08295 [Streptomyces alboflavus]